uniref:Uncharacterized protein n=1 Tax=Mimivirus LCMiAC02 TaxID=2506609 RepID=A0A4D5XFP4_9VIRU|nr:MAG: hypothetical protein LCMiAC02_03260 [Mimivirus LCMiAC02]
MYDFKYIYGFPSFYYSIYTSMIPYIYINKFYSCKKSIKDILHKYLDYGFGYTLLKEDKEKYFNEEPIEDTKICNI